MLFPNQERSSLNFYSWCAFFLTYKSPFWDISSLGHSDLKSFVFIASAVKHWKGLCDVPKGMCEPFAWPAPWRTTRTGRKVSSSDPHHESSGDSSDSSPPHWVLKLFTQCHIHAKSVGAMIGQYCIESPITLPVLRTSQSSTEASSW